ncbi:bifunctional phosphopantothenoylcysteine decarboxylase/phosphopantothenate--cysteine ligase CoaBC [Microlunatus soli]|uniref:Coenzyme A biosynthesis bifunctional protein CoaBC n=1 Tax=Microlunatus soli TaxID=630515 RepID=A0A1H2AJ31_9ACTN|nr:bifunctional phosphopantothenoylcysteine decarboxylase/phosphopantothenate--cysteine ligase CoaBC [Microlunatus soli]SDT46025.1 Phosphopantothenate-cysteine ligase /Phosphopantothenoylcysteine decarboxylase [Microlunatus soli]
MSRILLGVAGGIAAYKAAELLRRLKEPQADADQPYGAGHDLTVVPTAAALEFVGAPTWAALSGHPVQTDVFTDVESVPHVALGRQADLIVVAPATADLLSRAATGRADDLLTSCLLTATCPVIFAPAMHTEMWLHPATQANVATLRARGAVVIDPDSGRLTGADTGPGRLPDPAELARIVRTVLQRPELAVAAAARDLAGLQLVVSAGGTREQIDPVRFVGNASSGLMGQAIARAAVLRGAGVDLIAANVDLPSPAGVRTIPVGSTLELQAAVTAAGKAADVVVMAAAPADFRPAQAQSGKIKKSDPNQRLELSLVQNPDILAGLVADRTDRSQVLVGFAAETADTPEQLVDLGRAKLARKGCDLLVLNAVGRGRVFGQADSEIRLLRTPSEDAPAPDALAGSKDTLAHHILDEVLQIRSGR